MSQGFTGLTPALLSVEQAVVGSHKFSTAFGSARSKTINLSIHPKEIDMSTATPTPTHISVPNKEDLATVGPRFITGKVSIVNVNDGTTVVVIAGGENPGQYRFSSKVKGSVEAALSAMNNKNSIWAVTEEGSLDLGTFAVYAN
jgi:hypothetical protein